MHEAKCPDKNYRIETCVYNPCHKFHANDKEKHNLNCVSKPKWFGDELKSRNDKASKLPNIFLKAKRDIKPQSLEPLIEKRTYKISYGPTEEINDPKIKNQSLQVEETSKRINVIDFNKTKESNGRDSQDDTSKRIKLESTKDILSVEFEVHFKNIQIKLDEKHSP